MTSPMRYDQDYRESVELPEGPTVLLRSLKGGDKALLADGFRHLSTASRYFRFFSPKARLTDSDLRYLTEVDGTNHFGIAGLEVDDEGNEGAGVAVARFVRLKEEPQCAEPAITVIDSMQGKGLGKLLCRRLAAAARERGIVTFRCFILSENARVKQVIRHLYPGAEFVNRDGLMVAELEVTRLLDPSRDQ